MWNARFIRATSLAALILGAFFAASPVVAATPYCGCLITVNNQASCDSLNVADDATAQASCNSLCQEQGEQAGDASPEPFFSADANDETAKHNCEGSEKSVAPATNASAEPTHPFITPQLSFNIPGLTFTPILNKNGTLEVNFIADYVTAAYRVLLGVSVTIAIVMIMIGGFQYVISPATGDVKAAKERILNAVVGLVLLLSVYVILFTINPQLTLFQSLKIKDVEAVGLEQIANDWDNNPDTSGGVNGAVAGSHTPAFASCPIALSGTAFAAPQNAEDDPRNKEFFSKIGSVITATSVRDRITQIADAAAVCDVRFGSCGKTVETISALAGVGDQSCLTQGDSCRTYEANMVQPHKIPMPDIQQLSQYVCGEGCPTGWAADAPTCAPKFSEAAIAQAAAYFKSTQGADYPDAWVKDLQPGDAIWVYNANDSCAGLHSLIFLGQGSNGEAQVVDGSMNRNAKAHSICLSSTTCGNMRPLVRVFRSK